MSKRIKDILTEHTAKGGIIFYDIDGVLAAYEFAEYSHMTDEPWEQLFQKENETPYDNMQPISCIQEFIRNHGVEKAYACSVAEPYEAKAKSDFVTKNYGIPDTNIYFVRSSDEKLERIKTAQELIGNCPAAVVDDTIQTLNKIHEKDKSIITVHISSFLD